VLEQVVRAVGDDDQPPLARGLKSHPGRDEHALGLGEDLARREVWLQRALDNWHLAEAHDIGVIAIIALVLLSSCFYVWTIVKSLLPKPALKKD